MVMLQMQLVLVLLQMPVCIILVAMVQLQMVLVMVLLPAPHQLAPAGRPGWPGRPGPARPRLCSPASAFPTSPFANPRPAPLKSVVFR